MFVKNINFFINLLISLSKIVFHKNPIFYRERENSVFPSSDLDLKNDRALVLFKLLIKFNNVVLISNARKIYFCYILWFSENDLKNKSFVMGKAF